MTKNRRQPVRSKTAAITRRVVEPETIVESKPVMSKLRVGMIASDTSPYDIRDLLDDIGTVGEVSIHSDQNFTYALADMPYGDAKDAVEFLDNLPWHGNRIKGGVCESRLLQAMAFGARLETAKEEQLVTTRGRRLSRNQTGE
jgi:hypothetical protein